MPPVSSHCWACDKMDFSEDRMKPQVGSHRMKYRRAVQHPTNGMCGMGFSPAVCGELPVLSPKPHPWCPQDTVPQRTPKTVYLVTGMSQPKFARLVSSQDSAQAAQGRSMIQEMAAHSCLFCPEAPGGWPQLSGPLEQDRVTCQTLPPSTLKAVCKLLHIG